MSLGRKTPSLEGVSWRKKEELGRPREIAGKSGAACLGSRRDVVFVLLLLYVGMGGNSSLPSRPFVFTQLINMALLACRSFDCIGTNRGSMLLSASGRIDLAMGFEDGSTSGFGNRGTRLPLSWTQYTEI